MRPSASLSGVRARGKAPGFLNVSCRVLRQRAAALRLRAALPAVLVAFALCVMPVLAADPVVTLGNGPLTVAPGQSIPFIVSIFGVQDLYGFDLQLSFDPTVLEVVDSDGSTPGIQSAAGSFISPDFVVRNQADNQAGKVEFVVTQLNPRPARSGNGTLLTVSFRGLVPGKASQVVASKRQLADRNGVLIRATVAPGEVRVAGASSPSGSTATFTPTGAVTGGTATRTVTAPAASAGTPTRTPFVLAALPSATAPAAAAASPTPLPAVTPGPTATRPTATAIGTALKRDPETASPAPPAQPGQAQAAGKTPTPAATPSPVPSVSTSAQSVTPSSAGAPQPTILVPAATATPVLLARSAAGAPGKPILSGNAASGADADSTRTARSETPASAMLMAAGVALGIALVCLAAAGVLLWRRRRA